LTLWKYFLKIFLNTLFESFCIHSRLLLFIEHLRFYFLCEVTHFILNLMFFFFSSNLKNVCQNFVYFKHCSRFIQTKIRLISSLVITFHEFFRDYFQKWPNYLGLMALRGISIVNFNVFHKRISVKHFVYFYVVYPPLFIIKIMNNFGKRHVKYSRNIFVKFIVFSKQLDFLIIFFDSVKPF